MIMKFNKKKFNLVFHASSIALSLVIVSFISSEATGVINTVDSLVFPNSFIKKEFNTTEPWIEYSYLLRNNHFNVLETVAVEVEIDCAYVALNNSLQRRQIFVKREVYHHIPPNSVLHYSNNHTKELFFMGALNAVWSDINASMPISYLITFHVDGVYIGRLAKFSLIFRDLNLSRYEYPF